MSLSGKLWLSSRKMRMIFAYFLGGGGESYSEGRETNRAFNSVRDYIVSRDQIGQFWNVLDLVYIRLNLRVY